MEIKLKGFDYRLSSKVLFLSSALDLSILALLLWLAKLCFVLFQLIVTEESKKELKYEQDSIGKSSFKSNQWDDKKTRVRFKQNLGNLFTPYSRGTYNKSVHLIGSYITECLLAQSPIPLN